MCGRPVQGGHSTFIELRALTWNLFHGRDHPPDPALFTLRSRLLRITEANATHVQVNRELRAEFEAVLCGAGWDVVLLQECPPRWAASLGRACEADAHGALTSRNSLASLRALVARLNPDLIGAGEGGSNLTLVRGAEIAERRELELRPGPRPERRVLAFTRLRRADGSPLCVANLHASAGAALRAEAEAEVLAAAARSVEWAAGAPLLFGGDLNLRPRESAVFGALERRFGLGPATAPDALDHLLARGLEVLDPPAPWPAARREISRGGLAIRLSDHAPVEGRFG